METAYHFCTDFEKAYDIPNRDEQNWELNYIGITIKTRQFKSNVALPVT